MTLETLEISQKQSILKTILGPLPPPPRRTLPREELKKRRGFSPKKGGNLIAGLNLTVSMYHIPFKNEAVSFTNKYNNNFRAAREKKSIRL